MLSYQHIYHAGCAADVHKHAALALILSELVKNPAPVSYAETHAGRGLYDLNAPEALKTGEAKTGVMRLAAAKNMPDAMMPYMRVITQKRGEYPGSPLIAARLLRPQDTIDLCELHPQEFAALEKNTKADNRITPHKADGYETVKALKPSLVFIDPSYEIKSEYEQAAAFAAALPAQAAVILWMPLLAANRHEQPLQSLDSGFRRFDAVFAEPGAVRGMYGSALAVRGVPATALTGLAEIGAWVSENCRP
jgi:23S rRNA (adenine2030-N6)-methyltransferase